MEEFSDIIEFLNSQIEYMRKYIEKLESENRTLNRVLDKSLHIIKELNDCTNQSSDEYPKCPFRNDCEKSSVCLSTKEKWFQYLMRL